MQTLLERAEVHGSQILVETDPHLGVIILPPDDRAITPIFAGILAASGIEDWTDRGPDAPRATPLHARMPEDTGAPSEYIADIETLRRVLYGLRTLWTNLPIDDDPTRELPAIRRVSPTVEFPSAPRAHAHQGEGRHREHARARWPRLSRWLGAAARPLVSFAWK